LSGGAESSKRWFELHPERVEWEIEQFQAEGCGLPSRRIREDGGLSLITEVAFHGKPEEIELRFPADYPNAPPRVHGPAHLLTRHQQPFSGDVCVVDNIDNWWRPQYPAVFLIRQLRLLIEATERGKEAVAEGEADLPEPLTGYVAGRPNDVVLIPEEALASELPGHEGEFQLAELRSGLRVLASLRGSDGTEIAALRPELAERLGASARGVGKPRGAWIAFSHVPAADEWHEVEAAALAAAKRRSIPLPPRKKRQRRIGVPPRQQLVGVTFLEEGSTRKKTRRTWVFYDVEQRHNEEPHLLPPPIETQALSARVREQRIPELRGLQECRFVVAGAGTLGSAITLELAKAGAGQIEIIDADRYDLNNSVRHVLGTFAAGREKAPELAGLAESLNPFVTAIPHVLRIGGSEEDRAEVIELVQQASVVIDATGSHTALRTLHSYTAPRETPLVSVALTPGGYGGRVITLSGRSPCFDCFLAAQDAGELPMPEEGPISRETPYACSHPAAACAGFDALEFACHATRVAVQAAAATEYPAKDADWIIVNLRTPAERWQQGTLQPHRDCPWCGEP
jgi:molybdopterin/thiamine biosynthesis adenylyltransferase